MAEHIFLEVNNMNADVAGSQVKNTIAIEEEETNLEGRVVSGGSTAPPQVQ